MSLGVIILLVGAISLIFWTRRIVKLVFGVSRAINQHAAAKDVGPSFEERLEEKLARLAAEKSAAEASAGVVPIRHEAVAPAPTFGRKRH